MGGSGEEERDKGADGQKIYFDELEITLLKSNHNLIIINMWSHS